MPMATFKVKANFLLLLFSLSLFLFSCSSSKTTPSSASSTINTTTSIHNSDEHSNINISSSSSSSMHIRSVCKSTPFPDTCYDSLKLSISINISPNILTYLLHSLQTAISESNKLSDLLSATSNNNRIIENQRGTLQDCRELHQITLSSLKRSMPLISSQKHLADAKAFLSASLTNKNTCLEGLDSASGPLKQTLSNSFIETYKHVSNSLSLLSSSSSKSSVKVVQPKGRRRLMSVPKWLSRQTILQSDEYEAGEVLMVSPDGTGNFSTITDAINFAPNNSVDRVIIYVREGVYEENVAIPSYKPNIVLLGDGSNVTVITGNRSVVNGWTTFRSATLGKYY